MSTRTLVLVLALSSGFAGAQAAIPNIGTFLEQCPDRDPVYSQIKQDFQIRRNDNPVPEPVCTEPISAIPLAQYTDELIVRQGLRTIYYMDRGQSGHLPWTAGSLYDWMKSKIGGINIVNGVVGGYCCAEFDGKRFIVIGSANDLNRDIDKIWAGISGNIDFYAHEVRHVDGYGHSSCCGIPNGCDDVFDPANLSAYGVQWWLNRLWLDGTINVGYRCLDASSVNATTRNLVETLNSQFRSRFCTVLPPLASAPALPGGPCQPGPRRRAIRRQG